MLYCLVYPTGRAICSVLFPNSLHSVLASFLADFVVNIVLLVLIIGNGRNIYFPFDIVNDTALEVALEMVRELEISDREPMEIAKMIEEEISSLVPTWKKSCLPLKNHHNSFSYQDDDDDEETRPPFHTFSSCSSSHASLPNFNSPFSDANLKDVCNNMMNISLDWLQGIKFHIRKSENFFCF